MKPECEMEYEESRLYWPENPIGYQLCHCAKDMPDLKSEEMPDSMLEQRLLIRE